MLTVRSLPLAACMRHAVLPRGACMVAMESPRWKPGDRTKVDAAPDDSCPHPQLPSRALRNQTRASFLTDSCRADCPLASARGLHAKCRAATRCLHGRNGKPPVETGGSHLSRRNTRRFLPYPQLPWQDLRNHTGHPGEPTVAVLTVRSLPLAACMRSAVLPRGACMVAMESPRWKPGDRARREVPCSRAVWRRVSHPVSRCNETGMEGCTTARTRFRLTRRQPCRRRSSRQP